MPMDIKPTLNINFNYRPFRINLNYKPTLKIPIDMIWSSRKNCKETFVPWDVKMSDMNVEMIEEVKKIAEKALENYSTHSNIAAFIKKEFDNKFGSTWHCIVGRNFGAAVRPTTSNYISFNIAQVAVLLFKSG